MSEKEETTKEAVYRMYIKEGLFNQDIVAALGGRVKAITIRDYIQDAIRTAPSRGDTAPVRSGPSRKGGFKALSQQKPISQMHLIIGNRLNRHRETVENLRPQAFVEAHGYFVSAVLLRQMECGVHDFTLGQLQTIADILGIPVLKLMEPPTAHKS